MNDVSLLHLLLVLHLAGLSLMAGTNAADLVTFRAFCRRLDQGDTSASVLLEHMSRLGMLLGIGAGLLILSGLGLLTLTQGAFLHQRWFLIKLGLVALLIINGFAFGSRQTARIGKLVLRGISSPADPGLQAAIAKVRLFYFLQLMIFFVIIGLSVINVQ